MRKLYLSEKDKKIFGVCGGIGEAYELDSTQVRLMAVFLCILSGVVPLVVTYLVARIIVPEKPAE